MLPIPFLNTFVQKTVKRQTVADTVDHLNYYVTSYLLGFFAIAISAKQYFGSPIQCWVPNEFKGGWEKYVEDYCFIANSYHVSFDTNLPEHGSGREDEVSYYRWVPIVLALQSMCFFLPNYFWNVMHKQTAINPRAFLREAQKITELNGDKREEEITNLANYFMDTVSIFGDADFRTNSKFRSNPRSGRNAMFLYISTKFFYMLNIFGQLFIMKRFIGEEYVQWGYQTAWDILMGNTMEESSIFPRVIMCDFKVRQLGNIQNHTVQCVIMINMINEKLYLFLYFWFTFLAIATFINGLYYLALFLVPHFRSGIVMEKIDSLEKRDNNRQWVDSFVSECLHPDGVLLLQFVTEFAGDRVTLDLVKKVVTLYKAQEVGSYRSFSDDSVEKHPHSPLASHSGFAQPNFFPKNGFGTVEDYLEQGFNEKKGAQHS